MERKKEIVPFIVGEHNLSKRYEDYLRWATKLFGETLRDSDSVSGCLIIDGIARPVELAEKDASYACTLDLSKVWVQRAKGRLQ